MTLRLLGAFLLLGSWAAHACNSTEECISVIERSGRETHSLEAEFSQVKHISLLDEPLVSKGRLVFKKPDRLLLQIEEPAARSIVVHGNEVRISGAEAQQQLAAANTGVAAMLRQLGNIFTGSLANLDDSFTVSARRRGEAIEVDMVARELASKPPFRRIWLRFAGPHVTLQQIRLEDPFGDSLQITLEDVRRNVAVPDAAFESGAEEK